MTKKKGNSPVTLDSIKELLNVAMAPVVQSIKEIYKSFAGFQTEILQKVVDNERKVIELENRIKTLENENHSLNLSIHRLQMKDQSKQVIVTSFEENRKSREYCDKILNSVCSDIKLVEKPHSIFENEKKKIFRVNLKSRDEVELFFTNKSKLKGRHVFIEKPLTDYMKKVRKLKFQRAQELAKDTKFVLKNDSLIIGDNVLKWNMIKNDFVSQGKDKSSYKGFVPDLNVYSDT